MRMFLKLLTGYFVSVLPVVAGAFQDSSNSNLLSIAELQSKVEQGRAIESFRIDGVVCAIVPQRNLVVLQDDSASVLLELPSVIRPVDPGPSTARVPTVRASLPMAVPWANRAMHVGDRLAVEGEHCLLTRTRFGILVGMAPMVDNDGLHPEKEMSGGVFFPDAGMYPICVEWFNALNQFALKLEYEGPEISRQQVPASILWHGPAGETNDDDLTPGVDYAAYEGNGWHVLPGFTQFNPVAEGVATNLSVTYRTRDENCGLTFNGFIRIDHPGLYSFYLTSDDGAQFYVAEPSVSCETSALPSPSIPAPESFEEALADRSKHHWIEVEGEVAFVSENQRSLEMELVVGGRRVPVTVVEGGALFSTNLLHRWIRVDGNCEFSRDPEDPSLVGIFVPSSGQVKIYSSAESARTDSTNDLLTTAAQVRRLKPEEAGKHISSKIRGVVIYATTTAVVLQDSTGGVYITARARVWADQPRVGQLWEIEGATDPGDFSPVISADTAKYLGDAALPEPIRPTRDQLMNGNMDAEYGELQGVLTAVSNTEMTLLTQNGKVTVLGNDVRPLPQLPTSVPGGGSLVGSVVRIRGCFMTHWDLQTRQVIPGEIYLYPALVELEDPPPLDPFLLPTKKASDLMWFDARASALQRTKLAGQIIYALPGEYFILDGGTGFRVFAKDSPSLRSGDLIEAVGFPKLGDPSPVLQEAQIRKTGYAVLPDPVQVTPEKLLDQNRDSTLVQVEALLISDTVHQDEQVLELQSGPRHFVARLKSDPRTWTLLPADCRLQLTGVYASVTQGQNYAGANAAPFELLLNDAAGIVVLQQPPWWTVRRALAVMAALTGVLGVTFIWIILLRRKVEERTAQLKKEIEERQLVVQHHAIEQERSRVSQDLHDELGSGLTEMGLLGDLVNNSDVPSAEKQEYLAKLTATARSLVTSLDEIVWAVNPSYDSVAALASYYILFAQRFLDLAGVACRPQIPRGFANYPLASKGRHGLFLAFKEALNNVVRHSGATEVRLRIEVNDRELNIMVADNGHGFDSTNQVPGGEGLQGMRRRMKDLGGKCDIRSHPGTGTEIEFRLPLEDPEQ